MKLFIDTNILLEMYELSGPDLEELRKLVKLVETGKIELLLPQQVVDEFWRNREDVIADSLKQFRESGAQAKIPNIVRTYPGWLKLRDAVAAVNKGVKDLEGKVKEDIAAKTLRADAIVLDLFRVSTAASIEDDIVAAARLRADIGNPPGKKGSLGDAICWEWLLRLGDDSADTEIVILSSDGDFESRLVRGEVKEFLAREWEALHPWCSLRLEKSLAVFLQREFPDIKLAEEVERVVAVEQLEMADSFSDTHTALLRLARIEDFSDSELQRLMRTYLDNTQIHWILSDEDVWAFADKIVGLARSEEARALAEELADMMRGVQAAEADDEDPF